MPTSLATRVTLVFGGALAIALTVSGVAAWTGARSVDGVGALQRSKEILDRVGLTLSDLVLLGVAERAAVDAAPPTSDPRAGERGPTAIDALVTAMRSRAHEIRARAAGDPAQEAATAELVDALERRLATAKGIDDTARRAGRDAAQRLENEPETRREIERLHAAIQRVFRHEEGRVSEQASHMQRAGAGALVYALAGFGVAAVGLAGAALIARREIASRERALAEIARLKDEFVATASHELRTPVAAIHGSLGLLASGASGELPVEAREMARMALRNAERLSRLVQDVLDVDQLEAGGQKVRLQRVELQPIVDAAIVLDRAFAERFEVHLRLERPLPGAWVEADADRLGQVLSNLLSNAAKFSPRGGDVHVSIERRQAWLRVSVADRGEGVPEAFRPRLFQRFAQADGGDARSRGGSGLGLAVAKALVERQGGRIGFETGPTGSTFWFELKEMPAPPAARASREELTMSAEILRSVAAARNDGP